MRKEKPPKLGNDTVQIYAWSLPGQPSAHESLIILHGTARDGSQRAESGQRPREAWGKLLRRGGEGLAGRRPRRWTHVLGSLDSFSPWSLSSGQLARYDGGKKGARRKRCVSPLGLHLVRHCTSFSFDGTTFLSTQPSSRSASRPSFMPR